MTQWPGRCQLCDLQDRCKKVVIAPPVDDWYNCNVNEGHSSFVVPLYFTTAEINFEYQ